MKICLWKHHILVVQTLVRSELEDSDPSENNTKKHIPTHDYTRLHTSFQSSLIQIVFAESDKVNLSKINPMYVAQTLND